MVIQGRHFGTSWKSSENHHMCHNSPILSPISEIRRKSPFPTPHPYSGLAKIRVFPLQ